MMTLYLVTYRAIARNVDTTALSDALAVIPRDVDTESLLGLVPLVDVTTAAPPFVVRAMSYTSSPSAIIPNPQLGQFLAGYYRSTFSQALSTPVVASPVSTLVVPSVPTAWYRADAGAPSPVSIWHDMSGNGHDQVQATPSHQPLQLISPSISQFVVDFVGSGPNGLASVGPLAFDEFSYLLTFRSPTLVTAGMLLERSIDSSAHSGEHLYESSGAVPTIEATRSATTHNANLGANWAIDGHWHLAAYLYSHAAGGALFIDDLVTSVAGFAALPAQAVSDTLYLGARGAGLTLPATVAMRELLIFPSRLSPADLAAIGPYLRQQVGL